MNKIKVKKEKGKRSKFLTFKLGPEEYGLEIDKVLEIIGLQEITPVPKTPAYIRGVINLRGLIHPVIDLNYKFGMGITKPTKETCIIVVNNNRNGQQEQMGMIVDSVSEVEDIHEDDIEDAPKLGDSVNTDFICGIAKTKGKVKMLLDLQNTLSKQEFEIVNKVSQSNQEINK